MERCFSPILIQDYLNNTIWFQNITPLYSLHHNWTFRVVLLSHILEHGAPDPHCYSLLLIPSLAMSCTLTASSSHLTSSLTFPRLDTHCLTSFSLTSSPPHPYPFNLALTLSSRNHILFPHVLTATSSPNFTPFTCRTHTLTLSLAPSRNLYLPLFSSLNTLCWFPWDV